MGELAALVADRDGVARPDRGRGCRFGRTRPHLGPRDEDEDGAATPRGGVEQVHRAPGAVDELDPGGGAAGVP